MAKYVDDLIAIIVSRAAEAKENFEAYKPILMDIEAENPGCFGSMKFKRFHDNVYGSILHLAVQKGNYPMARFAIEQFKIDTNIRNSGNTPPLFFAVFGQNIAIAQLLLEHGAFVEIYNDYSTALMRVFDNDNYKEMAQLFYDYGVDVNFKSPLDGTALSTRAFHCQQDSEAILNHKKYAFSDQLLVFITKRFADSLSKLKCLMTAPSSIEITTFEEAKWVINILKHFPYFVPPKIPTFKGTAISYREPSDARQVQELKDTIAENIVNKAVAIGKFSFELFGLFYEQYLVQKSLSSFFDFSDITAAQIGGGVAVLGAEMVEDLASAAAGGNYSSNDFKY